METQGSDDGHAPRSVTGRSNQRMIASEIHVAVCDKSVPSFADILALFGVRLEVLHVLLRLLMESTWH